MTALTSKQRAAKTAIVARLNEELRHMVQEPDITVYGPLIVNIFAAVPRAVWESIDNDIGNAAAGRPIKGYLVRRVRNSPEFGPQLFKALGR